MAVDEAFGVSVPAATGLSGAEVRLRVERGQVNRVEDSSSQSWSEILRRNAFTRLNLLLLALGGATLATGSAPDATFLVVAVVNTVVGAAQEARAKRQLDTLAVLNSPHCRVVRDGAPVEVAAEEVVLDDVLDLRPGDEVPADAEVVEGTADLDESMATGESDPVSRRPGERLLSGSWVVSGGVRATVTAVGAASFANQLAAEARRFSLSGSELMDGINKLLRWLSWILVVIAPVLLVRELQTEPWRVAVRLSVAGLVGMVPEGLVLLTTLAFLTAAVRLARRRVLVQELPAVETLARVDALCVDKTGTLTEGRVAFGELIVGDPDDDRVAPALTAMAADTAANATLAAIGEGLSGTDSVGWEVVSRVPFSSARKWSAVAFGDRGTWVLGAPEVVGGEDRSGLGTRAVELARTGARVVAVATTDAPLVGENLPDGLKLVALVRLAERTRPNVATTLGYFADQGVTVRVISGDNPVTAGRIAADAGVPDAERAVDARTLPESGDPTFAQKVEDTRVFGRVTPAQKADMVRALGERGHTVAMTGDGVNDVLALKAADLGVAMGSGSPITRGVAQVVLLDDDFDVLPSVVGEGRRVLGNIELVAVLFLVKNVYSLILSVAVTAVGWSYPFLPRHLTLISAVGIGIPGFFLALGPNDRRFRAGFLRRVLTLSVLAGAVAAAAVFAAYAIARAENLSGPHARTAAVTSLMVVTLWVLWLVAGPATRLRHALVAAMGVLFAAAYVTPGISGFFSLDRRPPLDVALEALALGAVAAAVIHILYRLGPVRRLAQA